MPKSDGYYCPNCGAHKALITYPKGEARVPEGSDLPIRCCKCSSCKATWIEVYHVTEYQYLEVPDPPDPVQELLAAAEALIVFGTALSDGGGVGIYDDVYDRLKTAVEAVKSTL